MSLRVPSAAMLAAERLARSLPKREHRQQVAYGEHQGAHNSIGAGDRVWLSRNGKSNGKRQSAKPGSFGRDK